MSDTFPTFRQVGLAMIGIADHFSLMQTVFFSAAAVSVACFGYLFYTTTSTSGTVGRVGERLKIVERDVGDIKQGIGDISKNMAAMQEDMGAIKIGDISKKMAAMQENMAAMQEDMAAMQEDMGAIKIGDISKNMATMQENMAVIKKGMGDSQGMLSKIGLKDNSGEFFMPPAKSGVAGVYIEDLRGLAPALVNTKAYGGAWLYSKDAELIKALKETGIFEFRALKETGISQFRALKDSGISQPGKASFPN